MTTTIQVLPFASRTLLNIHIGILYGVWATPCNDDKTRKANLTRAKNTNIVAKFGIFYDMSRRGWTVPTLITSLPEAEDGMLTPIEPDSIWPGQWYGLFNHHPIGKPSELLPNDQFSQLISQSSPPENYTRRLPFTTIYTTAEQWAQVLKILGFNKNSLVQYWCLNYNINLDDELAKF